MICSACKGSGSFSVEVAPSVGSLRAYTIETQCTVCNGTGVDESDAIHYGTGRMHHDRVATCGASGVKDTDTDILMTKNMDRVTCYRCVTAVTENETEPVSLVHYSNDLRHRIAECGDEHFSAITNDMSMTTCHNCLASVAQTEESVEMARRIIQDQDGNTIEAEVVAETSPIKPRAFKTAMSLQLAKVDGLTNTNKTYLIEIKFNPVNARWNVVTSWGRVGSKLQQNTYDHSTEKGARRRAMGLAEKKRKKGYVVQAQPEKEAAQSLTNLRQKSREALQTKRSLGQTVETDELLYDLSRVTTAMHRLASDRYTALGTAERYVDGSMTMRFDTTDEGRLIKEMWGRMFEPTAKRNNHQPTTLAAGVREVVHQQLDELPEWAKIQSRCRRDAVLSSVTTRHLAEHVVSQIIADYPEPDRSLHPMTAEQFEASFLNDGGKGSPDGNQADETPGDGSPAQYISDADKAQIRADLAKGLQGAMEHLDSTEQAMNFAWGRGPSDLDSSVDPDEALALAELLSKDKGLAEMMDLVGKYMTTFRDIEASEYGTHGTTPFSVTPDNDLRRLLPSERIGLVHPLLQLQTMYRFMNKQTLCFDVRSREPKSHGPFVVCLDTSSSMLQLTEAKAFAIAAMQTAANEDRDVHLVRFASVAHDVDMELTRPGPRVKAMVDVGRITAGGGTCFDNAFTKAQVWLSGREGADILFITDGQCEFNPGWPGTFGSYGTDLHYIHIGTEQNTNQPLVDMAVQTLTVDDLDSIDSMASVAIAAARKETT